jgi:hypothetical protein
MRRALVLAVPLGLALLGTLAAADKAKGPDVASRPDYIPLDDPKVLELVRKLDAADAYTPSPSPG